MTRFDERKAEILQELQAEAQAAVGRKRAIRATSTAAALALVAAGAWWLMPGAPMQAPPQPQIAHGNPSIITTSVNLDDYAISDDELLAALDETGEPYTLIWVDGAPQLIEPPEQETQADSI